MENRIIADTHCDTISVILDEETELTNTKYSVNMEEALNHAPYIQCFAAYVDPKYIDQNKGAYKRAIKIIDKFNIEAEKSEGKIQKIITSQDIDKVIENNLIGAVLTIENGSAICGDLENIQEFHKRGVQVMSVTWNLDNELACGALTKKDEGLTKLGKQYIKRLEKNNILVDISHTSEKSFYNIAMEATKPIIATHSNAKKICDHPRNLTDDQIKVIAKMNGLIGICFYGKFLTPKEESNIDDIINHIDHIARLVGTDYISLGSDFEGFTKQKLPKNLTGIRDINNLFKRMKTRGFTDEEINKIAGKNVVRILKQSINNTF